MWYVYIIRSVEKEFTYVGYTSDVNRRLEQHNAGLNQSTKAYAPFTVEAYVALPSKEKAIELEKEIFVIANC